MRGRWRTWFISLRWREARCSTRQDRAWGASRTLSHASISDTGCRWSVGLKARIGGRDLFVPIARIASLEPGAARAATTKLNLARFERRPGEVLLREDVLGHSA